MESVFIVVAGLILLAVLVIPSDAEADRKRHPLRKHPFWKSPDGTAAIEFAIIGPAFCALLIASLSIWQLTDLKSDVRFVSQSAAFNAAVVLKTGGDQAAATAAAQSAIAANRSTFQADTVLDPAEITFDADNHVTVAVRATVPSFIPLYVNNLTATARATQ